MRNTFTIPDELLNKIGTEEGNFIITTVHPQGKRWKVWGIEKPFTPTKEEVEEWKTALKLQSKGEFGFAPGRPIGFFETVKS
jgi:hypothetical protein